MNIIKRGNIPESPEYFEVCTNCLTEFSFEKREAEQRPSIDGKPTLIVHCPGCGRPLARAL